MQTKAPLVYRRTRLYSAIQTGIYNAQLTYSLTDNGAEGDIAITRVIPGGQALCEDLTGAD